MNTPRPFPLLINIFEIDQLRKNIITGNNDIIVYSDKYRIKQILTNFMSNAYKFTDKGYIEQGLSIHDDNLVVSIKDTGIGISKENVEIIFDRFRKVEDDKTKLYRGNGMGLAISFKLSEILGSKIWVESEVNKGSYFYLSIPISQTKISNIKKLDNTINDVDLPYNWSGKNILICEDEETSYIYLETILRQTKAKIYWANNGQEAIEKAQAIKKIDVILMDIKMPIIDGYQALKIIKETNPSQIIIAQTAYATFSDQQKIIQAGFDGYISKPIFSKKLFTILNSHLM